MRERGCQATLHESKILAIDGFLGPDNPDLNVGDVQDFNCKVDANGPYYLNCVQRELRKHDVIKGKRHAKLKKYLRSELD